MSAERRFGKTYVIQKMAAEPPAGVLTFYQDLEKLHTADGFANEVCGKVMSKQRLSYRMVRAVTDEAAEFAALRNLLNAKRKTKDEDEVRRVLDLLRQDHYLTTDPYRFQLPLIRRFWRVWRKL